MPEKVATIHGGSKQNDPQITQRTQI
jgi:hypothetical protein